MTPAEFWDAVDRRFTRDYPHFDALLRKLYEPVDNIEYEVAVSGYAQAALDEHAEHDDDVRMLLDGLGCETVREAKRLVDLGREYDDQPAMRRDATLEEIEQEPDAVLESIAAGELNVTEATQHLAQAELDHRRQRSAR